MKAVVYEEYGSPEVLRLQEVEKPAPKHNEIRVKIYTTSVGFGDLMARKMDTITPSKFSMPMLFWLPTRFSFGFQKPKKAVLGAEFAGVVEGIGQDVTLFKEGDEVFGYRGAGMGTYAEYICIPEDSIVTLKPSNMTFEEAATVPYGTLTALNLLRKMNIQTGAKSPDKRCFRRNRLSCGSTCQTSLWSRSDRRVQYAETRRGEIYWSRSCH